MRVEDINKIYDGFGPNGQNMTRAEFHKELYALTNQVDIQRDLGKIELIKARERSARINIDRKLK